MKRLQLLCAVVTLGFGIGTAGAAVVSYGFTTSLDSAYGTLAAGSTISGRFSFETNQTPEATSLSNVVRYAAAGFQVSDGSQTVVFNNNDIWIAVGDNNVSGPAGDFFSVRMSDTSASPPTLGGMPVSDFVLIWDDPTGTAFSGFPLPTGENYFAALPSTQLGVDDIGDPNVSNYASASGVIDSVAPVSLPSSSVLLLSGVFALFGAGFLPLGARTRS